MFVKYSIYYRPFTDYLQTIYNYGLNDELIFLTVIPTLSLLKGSAQEVSTFPVR